MEIKKKGVKSKKYIYPRICDQGSSQTKLLSSMDYEKGKINIYILELNDQNIKSSENYKVTNISVDSKVVNYVDKMDLHRKIREMIHKDVMLTSLGMNKLYIMNENIYNQLK